MRTFFFSLVFAAAFASAARLHKRIEGEATYYAVGLGACGGTNVPSDWIVALNSAQFDEGGGVYPGIHCGKAITIRHKDKTAQATIADRCPGCKYGDLDLSESLFSYFEDLGVGRFGLSWEWGSGGGGNPQPQPQPTSSSSARPPPPPEQTVSSYPASTSLTLESTLSRSSASQQDSSSSSETFTSTSVEPSSSSAPTSIPTGSNGPGNFYHLQVALVNLGNMIRTAGELSGSSNTLRQ